MIVVGAALAPLTWYVADQAAAANGLTGRRRTTVALGSGLVAALFGPFLVAVTGPDSSVPFAVLAVAACCAMPRALDAASGRRWGVALGVLLGLAYLARQEAIWLGLHLPVAPPARAAPARGRRAGRLAGPDPGPGRRRPARSWWRRGWFARRSSLARPSPDRPSRTCGSPATRTSSPSPSRRRWRPSWPRGRRSSSSTSSPACGTSWWTCCSCRRCPSASSDCSGWRGPGGPPPSAAPTALRAVTLAAALTVPGHRPPVPGRHAGRDVPARLRAGPRGPRGGRRARHRPGRRGHRGVARLGQAERLAGAASDTRSGAARDGPRGLAHRLLRLEPGGAGERGGGGPGGPAAGPGRRARGRHQRRTDRLRAWPPGGRP